MREFRDFAFKGNVVDLAVGVVIGGAFGKIVSALVSDIIMPLVALLLPSGDWRTQNFVLRHAPDAKDNVVLHYGDFLGSVLDLLVIALTLFVVVGKVMRGAERRLAQMEPKRQPTEPK